MKKCFYWFFALLASLNLVSAFANTTPVATNDKTTEEVADDVKDADKQVAVVAEEEEIEEEQE